MASNCSVHGSFQILGLEIQASLHFCSLKNYTVFGRYHSELYRPKNVTFITEPSSFQISQFLPTGNNLKKPINKRLNQDRKSHILVLSFCPFKIHFGSSSTSHFRITTNTQILLWCSNQNCLFTHVIWHSWEHKRSHNFSGGAWERSHKDGRRVLNWVLKRNKVGGRELDSTGFEETTGGTLCAWSWGFIVYKTREIPPPPQKGLWSMEFKLS